jgi:hypothetical protein
MPRTVDYQSRVNLNGKYESYRMSWALNDETPLGQRLNSNDHLVTAKLSGNRWLTLHVTPPPDFAPEYRVLTDDEVRQIGVRSDSFGIGRCGSVFE